MISEEIKQEFSEYLKPHPNSFRDEFIEQLDKIYENRHGQESHVSKNPANKTQYSDPLGNMKNTQGTGTFTFYTKHEFLTENIDRTRCYSSARTLFKIAEARWPGYIPAYTFRNKSGKEQFCLTLIEKCEHEGDQKALIKEWKTRCTYYLSFEKSVSERDIELSELDILISSSNSVAAANLSSKLETERMTEIEQSIRDQAELDGDYVASAIDAINTGFYNIAFEFYCEIGEYRRATELGIEHNLVQDLEDMFVDLTEREDLSDHEYNALDFLIDEVNNSSDIDLMLLLEEEVQLKGH